MLTFWYSGLYSERNEVGMKTKLKRILAVLAACAITLFGSGCGKGGKPAHGALDTSLTDAAGERFVPVAMAFPDGFWQDGASKGAGSPDGYSMSPGGTAAVDGETGALLVTAQYADRAAGICGEISVFAFSRDGELLSRTALPTGEGEFLGATAFSGGTLWVLADGTERSILRRVDLENGKLLCEAALSTPPEMPAGFSPERMAPDGDGDLWLASGNTVLVYTADLRFVGSVKLNGAVSSLAVDQDGRVWASAAYGNAGERGAVRLDKEKGGYDEAVTLDGTNRNIAFSSDGSLYYDTQNGIRCLSTDEKGNRTVKPVMSFLASGVIWQEGGSLVSGEGVNERAELMLAVPGEDGGLHGLLFRSVKPEKNRLTCLPVLYVPAGEEDAEDTVTLQLAFAREQGTALRQQIVRFNAEHPDIQITTLDYSIYNDTYDAGAEKLLLDMTTGIVSPDIVVGGSNSLEMMTLARKDMTLDLLPYLEKEDELNPDNIFGMVLRFFDNGKGGLWGFTPTFLTETWVSSREILGPYGSDEGWGVAEYLDFAETLPEGRYLSFMHGTRDVNSLYLPGVFESFVDLGTGTCSFDSPLFIRYIGYLDALPPRAEVSGVQPEYREMSELTRQGFYALSDAAGLPSEYLFGTRDYVIVGYPSDDPAGRVTILNGAYVISRKTAHPDEAWEFLRSLFLDPELRGELTSILKSDYDAAMEQSRKYINIHFADGSWTTWPELLENYAEAEPYIEAFCEHMMNGIPWTVEPPDEEQYERIRLWLDTAGGRAIDLLPPEVNELIREELSAFLGGVGTAEDCAKKIQSRVSIWLAEND